MQATYDAFNRLERPVLTLCNPGCVYNNSKLSRPVGNIPFYEALEFIINFNSPSEINFRANEIDAELATSLQLDADRIFEGIQARRLIYVEDVGFFMITEVTDGYDGLRHYKDVKGESIEVEYRVKNIPYIADDTYRFYNSSVPSKTMLYMLATSVPGWTIDHVDTEVAERYRTFEDVDINKDCLSFMINDLQQAYECVILFDTSARSISVYDKTGFIRSTNICITRDDVVRSLNITEDTNDLFTALRVEGDKNISIGIVNPIGISIIYNFTHYLPWMSEHLRTALGNWQSSVALYERFIWVGNGGDEDEGYAVQYLKSQHDFEEIVFEINRLNSLLNIYNQCLENIEWINLQAVNEQIEQYSGDEIDLSKQIDEIINFLENKISEYTGELEDQIAQRATIETTMNELKYALDAIHRQLSFEEWLTRYAYDVYNVDIYDDNIPASTLNNIDALVSEMMAELHHYIYEGVFTDENITITDIMTINDRVKQYKDLYDKAVEQLSQVSQPTQEFTVDSESFIFSKEFEKWTSQLETGCLIEVQINAEETASLFLTSFTYNYDDHNFSMTFSNRYRKFDKHTLFDDMLGQISQSANSLQYIQDLLTPALGDINHMKNALQNARNVTMLDAITSSNEEIVIDESGYTGRRLTAEGEYDPQQVKLTSQSLVFTDDGWRTCKVAVGKLAANNAGQGNAPYGINAEAIIGDLITGNRLRILDNNGNELFDVVDGKISSSVSAVQETVNGLAEDVTRLEQTADEISLSIQHIDHITTSTNYTFDADGLRIQKSGESILNLINNTGMYVKREAGSEEEVVLAANSDGVNALNLTARQFLTIGTKCRFEDYNNGTDGNRTACYAI